MVAIIVSPNVLLITSGIDTKADCSRMDKVFRVFFRIYHNIGRDGIVRSFRGRDTGRELVYLLGQIILRKHVLPRAYINIHSIVYLIGKIVELSVGQIDSIKL